MDRDEQRRKKTATTMTKTPKKNFFWHSGLKSNEISRFITQLILSNAAKGEK